MINKTEIISSIFYPRKSFLNKDKKDMLVPVDTDITVGVRLFLSNIKYPTILYFHGNAELAQEYESIAEFYNQYNLNLIVADYRGYGLSEGTPNKNNLHGDAIKIFDYILLYLESNNYSKKIIIMGRSLGSASACEIISKREEKISKCIIESGFGTEYPLLDLMNIDPKDINYSLSDGFQNLSKLKRYKKPIYFIHADKDNIIPISEAELMIKACGAEQKDLFVVNGANHNNIIMTIRDTYFKRIKEFIYHE